MHREGPLDADAVAFLSDGEGLADAPTGATQHHTLEHLNTLLVAFDDLDVDLNGVTRAEVRDVIA